MKPNTTERRRRAPWAELLLVVGLPVAAVLAGLVTVAIAAQHGFTPAAAAVAPKGH